jgi:hypothetical protein
VILGALGHLPSPRFDQRTKEIEKKKQKNEQK